MIIDLNEKILPFFVCFGSISWFMVCYMHFLFSHRKTNSDQLDIFASSNKEWDNERFYFEQELHSQKHDVGY